MVSHRSLRHSSFYYNVALFLKLHNFYWPMFKFTASSFCWYESTIWAHLVIFKITYCTFELYKENICSIHFLFVCLFPNCWDGILILLVILSVELWQDSVPPSSHHPVSLYFVPVLCEDSLTRGYLRQRVIVKMKLTLISLSNVPTGSKTHSLMSILLLSFYTSILFYLLPCTSPPLSLLSGPGG